MKPVVALDLDDLIYPFMDGMVPFHNERYGTALTVDDYHSFEFEQVWGGSREDAVSKVTQFFMELDDLGAFPPPTDSSVVAIDKLAVEFRLAIVTARFDELRELTLRWIDEHFPGRFDDVHLCNTFILGRATRRTKASVCEKMDAIALVDDSLANVTDVAATGRRGILFGNYAWNQSESLPERVVRAEKWDDVLSELMGEPK